MGRAYRRGVDGRVLRGEVRAGRSTVKPMSATTLTESSGRPRSDVPSWLLFVLAALAALSAVWIASSVVDAGDATCGRVVTPQSNSPDECEKKLGVLLVSITALSVAAVATIAVALRVSGHRARVGLAATTTLLIVATLMTVETLRSGGLLEQ